ncbi:MAG: hypothetical protein M1837_003687 [Sclerophora amabilis]|nr:MAG: hypothetical protein M1837_003687 [Sclerophora amabilis]
MAQTAPMAWPNGRTGLNNQIARDVSPHTTKLESQSLSSRASSKERGDRPAVRPQKEPKYNLWPSSSRFGNPLSGRSMPEFERSNSFAAGRSTSAMDERGIRSILNPASRPKNKENANSKRRKGSVPDLGPMATMTTVQEAPMDSPTIPGRPPLHERSASAPSHVHKSPSSFVESMVPRGTLPTLATVRQSQILESTTEEDLALTSSIKRKSPLSSGLAPLVIPTRERGLGTAVGTVAEGDGPEDDECRPEPPPKSPRTENRASPRPARSMTPADTSSFNRLNRTYVSAPFTAPEARSSPKPWNTPISARSPTRHQLQPTNVPVIERGRPTNRSEESLTRKESKAGARTPSAGENAFQILPLGLPAVKVPSKLPKSEIESLQQQALGQAAQFEVLSVKDVESLSRELRALDERCDYLRKTHHSLRSGRQGLHTRMVTYLTSPRMAQFSRESILKQEEALAELDTSIDDWVAKLDQAENRRTRVRQKLLEHVAAALTLRMPQDEPGSKLTREDTPPISPVKPPTPTPTRNERKEVESIKIYADSNVYRMFSEVDQAIDNIASSWGQLMEKEQKSF